MKFYMYFSGDVSKEPNKGDFYSIKDIYNELFHCRDFEIEHLWQRSVFLGTFMLAIAAGYGTFIANNVSSLLQIKDGSPLAYLVGGAFSQEKYDSVAILFVFDHAVCLSLGLLGMLFSQLWIMMGKGSKRWYEQYEEAISFFYDNADEDVQESLFGEITRKYINDEKIRYFGSLQERNVDDSLLSTAGGRFSVSRINIFIGQIMVVCWMIISSLHLTSIFIHFFHKCNGIGFCGFAGVVTVLFVAIIMRWTTRYFVCSKD